MRVYVCVCVCVYVCVDMNRIVPWKDHTCIHTYIHTYMHACMQVLCKKPNQRRSITDGRHSYTHIHTYIHIYIHTYTHTYRYFARSPFSAGTSQMDAILSLFYREKNPNPREIQNPHTRPIHQYSRQVCQNTRQTRPNTRQIWSQRSAVIVLQWNNSRVRDPKRKEGFCRR